MAYGAGAIPTATSIASVAGSGTATIVRVCPEKSSMKSYCVNGAMPVLRVGGAGFVLHVRLVAAQRPGRRTSRKR
jgi:hypothetical protein